MNKEYTAVFLTDEGGSASFYDLKESKTLGFKEFISKKAALSAFNIQTKLSKFGLAPKIYGKVTRIKIEPNYKSGWGFITQKVKITRKLSRKKIQDLVDKIYTKTQLRFWDCHEYNIGVYRSKYLCIDTGRESFDSDCNAWGNYNPGPKCCECNKYKCKCWF